MEKGFQFKEEPTNQDPDKPTKQLNHAWSKILAKVFKIDVTKCVHYEGKLRAVAAIQDRDEITRYPKHQGIDHEATARAPPKYKQPSLEFDSDETGRSPKGLS